MSDSFAREVRFVFAGSGALARQIRHGAPYDVYLSANEAFVRELVSAGKILPESVRVYAYGRLGLWSKSGKVRRLEDLLSPDIRHVAMANPLHAPYGLAAQQALKRRGLWPKVQPRIIYAENVQQAWQFAASGNADAVITAWSLLLDKGGSLVPPSWHEPLRQAGGVVRGAPDPAGAQAFLTFLTGAAGRQALARGGFSLTATE